MPWKRNGDLITLDGGYLALDSCGTLGKLILQEAHINEAQPGRTKRDDSDESLVRKRPRLISHGIQTSMPCFSFMSAPTLVPWDQGIQGPS